MQHERLNGINELINTRSINKSQAAHRIVQKYEKFVGTIRAIDAGAKMVRAKNLFTEKKFSLANGCKIIVDGKIDSGLDDLRIGETVEFSYEDVDGVLVANRIGSNANMPEVESTQTAQTTEQTQ